MFALKLLKPTEFPNHNNMLISLMIKYPIQS